MRTRVFFVFQDLLSGTGSAHNGIPFDSMALSVYEQMCVTEPELFDGDAPSHVIVHNHMNESEHVVSTVSIEQTDSVQEESFACATSDPPFPSSLAHSPVQRDVFSHHTDSLDLLDTSDD